jgi:hypothetical protein
MRPRSRLLAKLDYGLDTLPCSIIAQDVLKLQEIELDLPVYAPHELLGALYQVGFDAFSEVIFGGIPEGMVMSCVCIELVVLCSGAP